MKNSPDSAARIIAFLLFAHGYLTPLVIFFRDVIIIHPTFSSHAESVERAQWALGGWVMLALAFTFAQFLKYQEAQETRDTQGIFGRWLLGVIASSPLIFLISSLYR